jgi:hypothetical protein
MYAPDSNVVQAVEPPAAGEPAVTIRDNAANDWRLHPPKRETVAEACSPPPTPSASTSSAIAAAGW